MFSAGTTALRAGPAPLTLVSLGRLAGIAAAACCLRLPRTLHPTVPTPYCLVRAAVGSFVWMAGRVFLAEGAASLLFHPAGMQVNPIPARVSMGIVPHTGRAVDFKVATDVLTSAPSMTLGRIAAAFGKDTHTITRARMEGENARRPPAQWQSGVARLARDHAKELREYADELEKLATLLERR